MDSDEGNKPEVTVEQLRAIYSQLHELLEQRIAVLYPEENTKNAEAHKPETMRAKVQLEIEEFIFDTLEIACKSLQITNADLQDTSLRALIKESQDKYTEPFDLDLNDRVRKMYQEWEDQTVKVSQLRRSGPATVRQLYSARASQHLKEIDNEISNISANRSSTDAISDDGEQDVHADLELIANDYKESLLMLQEAARDTPKTTTNLEKLKSLIVYLETN